MDRSRTAFFFIVRSYHFVKISSWLDNNPTTTLYYLYSSFASANTPQRRTPPSTD